VNLFGVAVQDLAYEQTHCVEIGRGLVRQGFENEAEVTGLNEHLCG